MGLQVGGGVRLLEQQSWSPVLSGLAGAFTGPTYEAYYHIVGNRVFFEVKATFTTGSAQYTYGTAFCTLPVAVTANTRWSTISCVTEGTYNSSVGAIDPSNSRMKIGTMTASGQNVLIITGSYMI